MCKLYKRQRLQETQTKRWLYENARTILTLRVKSRHAFRYSASNTKISYVILLWQSLRKLVTSYRVPEAPVEGCTKVSIEAPCVVHFETRSYTIPLYLLTSSSLLQYDYIKLRVIKVWPVGDLLSHKRICLEHCFCDMLILTCEAFSSLRSQLSKERMKDGTDNVSTSRTATQKVLIWRSCCEQLKYTRQ